MPLPPSFPSPVDLPFNATSLKGRFRPGTPDRDPGGVGSCLLLRGGEILLPAAAPPISLPGEFPAALAGKPPLFLGTWDDRPLRALAVPREAELPAGWRAENLLAEEPPLDIDLLTLAGTAGQYLHWQRTGRFCSRCGGATEPLPEEWGRRCTACGYAHFPHIHPCVIVLVRRGGEVLLTRKPEWPPGRYGLVAGFLDPGECLEEAVVREVREETGVEVKNIRYLGSQCWPFPSQVMAGYLADWAGGEVKVEKKELEDARWFAVDELPRLPPRRSIARYLLDHHAGKG